MKKRPTDPTKIIDEIQISLSETKIELQAYKILNMSLSIWINIWEQVTSNIIVLFFLGWEFFNKFSVSGFVVSS